MERQTRRHTSSIISASLLAVLMIVSIVSQTILMVNSPIQLVYGKTPFVSQQTDGNNSSAVGNSSLSKTISPTKATLTQLSKLPAMSSEKKILVERSLEKMDRRGPSVPRTNVSITGPIPGTETVVNSTKLMANASIQKTAFQIIPDNGLSISAMHNNILAPNRDIIDEPAVANRGNLLFFTGNHYAARSLDGGSSWTYVNPFQDMPDFIGDQDVTYDPSNQIFAWIRMSNITQEGNNFFRLGISHDALHWIFYDLIPASFNSSWSAWDYPQIAVSNHYLYVTSDIYGPPSPSCTSTPSNDCTFKGTMISRADLTSLNNGFSTSFRFFADTSGILHVFTPIQGATTAIYWAAHLSNSEIRLYKWSEASTLVNSFDRRVPAWTDLVDNDIMSCPAPDHNNWCARSDSRITSGWIKGSVIGFFWNVNGGNGFPYPYIDAATFNVNGMTSVGRPYMWSSSYAWMYADGSPNQRGIALEAFYGGGHFYPSVAAAVDYRPEISPHSWHMYNIMSGTNAPAPNPQTGQSGWGDFIRIRPYSGSGVSWIASGYTLQGGSSSEFVIPFVFFFGIRGSSGDLPNATPQ